MITRLKDTTSEDPNEYVWKNLRYFQDAKRVAEQIADYHQADKGEPNLRKQATQLGYCIRQAEEYFRASSQVGLATRPTLLYYGAASLTKALVLLRLDGNHSFDALRKSKKHQHHGLDLLGTIK